jgi:phage terminase large subunit GpA-like protein
MSAELDLPVELRWQLEGIDWFKGLFSGITTHVEEFTPSQWAELRRYLPAANSTLPGPYRFSVTPYLKEIADCLAIDSPIRFVALQKGAQIGGTVGILENTVGYLIDHVKTAPVMFVTADAELAKIRLDTNILPMLQTSKLSQLITSADEGNKRKTGKTSKKLEWAGGGYLLPFGAKNANKLRSQSIQYLLNDEIDAWPLIVGRDGDPYQLALARTQGYEQSRKVFSLSTPLYKGQSRINDLFLAGDQRRYFVCCLKCGFPQVLRWRTNDAQGLVGGIVWERERGIIVPGSVRYLCQNAGCQHAHTNDDKVRLLAPENGAEWRPTATPVNSQTRSYHLSALYSPPGMHSWEAIAQSWTDAWDDERGRAKNLGKLQVFYNNELGEPFELRTKRLTYEHVSPHRRKGVYKFGEIPNEWARQYCGGAIQMLTCTVDVHADNLKVGVWGWCDERRPFLIDYFTFEGDTDNSDNPATWGKLEDLIENRVWEADDGRKYRLVLTLIDSGFNADVVYTFCQRFPSGGVYPIKGRELPPKNAVVKHFSEFVSKEMGVVAYGITVDLYKDRWSAALQREWDGQSLQPPGHFNAPENIDDKQLRELTMESKREKIDPVTRLRVGWEWHRPSGAANELWDLLIYASASLDMLAWDYFGRGQDEDIEGIDFKRFFSEIEEDHQFFEG